MAGDRKLALITGAAGFVGSRIARRFLREGMSVRALDQRPIDVAEVESCVGDVTDPNVAHRATGGAASLDRRFKQLVGAVVCNPCPTLCSSAPEARVRSPRPLSAAFGLRTDHGRAEEDSLGRSSGGKRGHSAMEHWAFTAEIKDVARIRRRVGDGEAVKEGLAEGSPRRRSRKKRRAKTRDALYSRRDNRPLQTAAFSHYAPTNRWLCRG